MRMNVGKVVVLMTVEVAICLVSAALIVITYTWLLPRYFHGARTYSVLVGITAIGAVSGGVVAKRSVSNSVRGWIGFLVTAALIAIFTVLVTLGALTEMFGA